MNGRPTIDAGATLLAKLKELVQLVGAVMLIISCVGGAVIWLGGGFRSGTRVAIDQLTGKMAELSAVAEKLNGKFEARAPIAVRMPTHEARLAHLDAQVEMMGNPLTIDEINAKGVATDVQRLPSGMNAQTRNPR